ncbi:MAG: hypothetical protein WAU31_03185 [Candidatus Moraniibacteriota bacterium]
MLLRVLAHQALLLKTFLTAQILMYAVPHLRTGVLTLLEKVVVV